MKPLDTQDVLDIIRDELKDGLRIEVTTGGFTDPNSRKIVVFFRDEEVASTYFDVVQQREYEG